MDVTLDIRKSIEENAAAYFEEAKKAKRKLAGAQQTIEKANQRIAQLQKEQDAALEGQEKKAKLTREQKWYHKFRWFFSSEGFLCVGGRDATSNEIVIKKHAEKNDVVFHTEMSGSPFFVIKTEGMPVGEVTLEEAAIAVASFSRAWRLGVTQAEVFSVKPEQLTKTPRAGEYVEKGSFIVVGKTDKQIAELKLAVGLSAEHGVMCAPLSAVKKHCPSQAIIAPGSLRTSEAAKKIRKKIGGEIDEIVRVLPSGGCRLIQS